MLIRFLQGVIGGIPIESGDVVDYSPDSTAGRFIKKGIAEVADPKKVDPAKIKRFQEPPHDKRNDWPPKAATRRRDRGEITDKE